MPKYLGIHPTSVVVYRFVPVLHQRSFSLPSYRFPFSAHGLAGNACLAGVLHVMVFKPVVSLSRGAVIIGSWPLVAFKTALGLVASVGLLLAAVHMLAYVAYLGSNGIVFLYRLTRLDGWVFGTSATSNSNLLG